MRFSSFIENVQKTILKPEMRILPGQLAFFFVLSIIPLIALVGTITSQLSLPLSELERTLSKVVPVPIMDLLLPLLSSKNTEKTLILFYISAFLLASNGTYSMIIVSNRIYQVEEKSYLFGRLKALLMTFILVLLLVFVLLVPAFGDHIIRSIMAFITSFRVKKIIVYIYQVLKYPLSFILIYLCIKALYLIAPDCKIKSKETTYGALLASFGWLVATEVYSVYVDRFMNYDRFYGSLANLIILFFWVYLLAYLFVLGMAFNGSVKEKKNDVNNLPNARQESKKRLSLK